jgi:molybdopterin molybdotransferase
MPSFEAAQRIILDHTHALGAESVELIDSLNMVTAEDIFAPWNMPLCDNSAMDGFAVRTADCAPGTNLRVTGLITAGAPTDIPVEPGCAVKVMTGARMPAGADAVVPFEDAESSDDVMAPRGSVKHHQHVRLAGSDLLRGEKVIPAGTVIRVPEISLMAAINMNRVQVFRRPRIAILSTGDELLEIGETVTLGKVVDSNGPSLAAAAKNCGAMVQMLGIARDTVASHVEKMTAGLEADIFITSAGVSVGERDLVREVLTGLGVSFLFHSVDVRPGGPATFGVRGNSLVFCLPGNPVAAMIIFAELVKPAILKAMGYKRVFPSVVRAILQENVTKKAGKTRFLRVRLEPSDGQWLAFSAGEQATALLKTLLLADGLAILPTNQNTFVAGEVVDVHLLSDYALMTPEEA